MCTEVWSLLQNSVDANFQGKYVENSETNKERKQRANSGIDNANFEGDHVQNSVKENRKHGKSTGIDNVNFGGENGMNSENDNDRKKHAKSSGIENANFRRENFARDETDDGGTHEHTNVLLEKTKFRNVMILSSAYMLILCGYLTSAATGATILRSYEERTGRHANGFIVQGVGYLTTALSVPFVPALLKLIGRKATMIIGGVTVTAFILTYINPMPELIYTFAVITGIGGSCLWIAQVSKI